MNKELEIPQVPQKIAVISSETAAGYGDFISQLENNEFEYKFYCKLFPAIMQGEQAEDSIIAAFDKIFEYSDFFDVVVLIRGGGSKADLSCFDNYNLAVNIAQFPLPVITGIGHERDESTADLTANTSVKTPTAAAELFISYLYNFDSYIEELRTDFKNIAENLINHNKTKLDNLTYNFIPLSSKIINNKKIELQQISNNCLNTVKNRIDTEQYYFENIKEQISYAAKNNISKKSGNIDIILTKISMTANKYLSEKKHQIHIFEQKNKYLNPKNTLKRGYTYTLLNGKLIKNSSEAKKGKIIQTFTYDGNFYSEVIDI